MSLNRQERGDLNVAKKARASFATTRTKDQTYRSTWLQNAMKSIGITSNEVIKQISPNLYEVTHSGVETTKEIVTSLRGNKNNINKVGESLKTNKYVQFAQKAYKNAISDIKSGSFNNKEREYQAAGGDVGIDNIEELTDGFSFGDDGAESSGVNVNIVNGAGNNNDAMMKISEQMSNQAVAQVKMQKASMDAYIAVNATNMQRMSQLGSEILSQLTNVNSNLAALVQYNNDNMTRFIESSLAYYNKVGSSYDTSEDGSSKISAKDVLNSGKGGINMSQYKSYVKQQFKDMLENSEFGLVKTLLDDDSTLELLAANPLGALSKGLVSYMVPKVLKTSLESMETTFSNFMPTMLAQVAELADDQGSSLMSQFRRVIGKTFGLKNERITKMKGAEIERGTIPFDGETKHAITEIITKELREQTGYLEIIANKFSHGKAKEKMKGNAEYWSWKSNSYIKSEQIDKDIAQEIVDAVTNTFRETKFGEGMYSLVDKARKEEDKKEITYTLDELMMDIEKSGKNLTLPEIIELVEKGGASKATKKVIKKHLKQLAQNDINAFQSVNVGRLRSQGVANEVKQQIMDNASNYHFNDSSFNDEDADVDELVAKIMGYGSHANNRRSIRRIKGATVESTRPDNNGQGGRLNGAVDFNGAISTITGQASSMMQSIMRGDTEGVVQQGAQLITDQLSTLGHKISKTLFGEKDEEGYSRDGIFSGVANGLSDTVNQLKWHLTGKGYKDSKGNTIDDKEDSVLSNFKKIGSEVKDGIMLKVFGKEKNEDGEYVKTSDSIFNKITDTFKAGFDGWTDAFFGTDEADDPEEAREQQKAKVIDYMKEALPNAITGSAIGAGVGMVSGGSILGMLVGGPIGGAAMGAAVGLLSKNEKFQNWLFGEKDEETGERAGGLISQSVQKYFKDNKTFLIGSAATGAVTGAITGGGLLGTLVGGPIAGSLMGMAGGIILKSDTFQKFLFGDEENGQKGLINGIKDAWSKHFKGEDASELALGGKAAGMTALGTGAGGLIGAILGGPVIGALAGFTLSVRAQSGNFKEWLFGKEDGIDLGNGKKVKKQGVIGMIGNTINANIIKPIKTEAKYISKDFMSTLKHKVLAPFAFLAEDVTDKIGGVFENITKSSKELFRQVTDSITSTLGEIFAPVTKAVGDVVSKGANFIWGTMKRVISTPGAIITATIKTLNLKEKFDNWEPVVWLKGLGKDIRKLLLDGVKKTFKGLAKLITLPFTGIKSAFDLIGKGAKALGKKLSDPDTLLGKGIGAVKNAVNNSTWMQNFRIAREGIGDKNDSIIQRINRNKKQYQEDQAAIKKAKETEERHNRNAQLINKYTNKQFSEDNDDAREWLKQHRPDIFRKLEGDSVTKEKKDAEIARNGRSTEGMSEAELDRARIGGLNEQGRQTKFLYNIKRMMEVIVKKMQGQDTEDYETDAERDEREEREARKARRDAKKQFINQKRDELIQQLEEKGIEYDPNMSRHELARLLNNQNLIENGQSEHVEGMSMFEQIRTGVRKTINDAKSYFKNDFFANTKENTDKYIVNREKTKTNEKIKKWTGDRFAEDSREARTWLQQNRPDKYAKLISQTTGEDIQSHATGGFIQNGLSLVGEKGAELLNVTDDGAEVLDADETEEAVNDALDNKKKKKKLSDYFKRKKKKDKEDDNDDSESAGADFDEALEQQSDEKRRNRLLTAKFKRGRAKTKEEENAASAEASVAILEHQADMSADSQEKALERGGKAAELQKAAKEEKYRKQQLAKQNAMLDTMKDIKSTTSNFKDLWSSIFSKKGLLTAAAIAGFALLKSKIPELVEGITGFADNVINGIKEFIQDLIGDIGFTINNDARTDGNTAGEQAKKNVDDIKNGDILTDSEGNATHQTEARTKLLARTGLNYINSGHHMALESKLAKKQKAVFEGTKKVGRGVKRVGTGIKNIGSRAGSWFEDAGTIADIAIENGDEAYELASGKGQKLAAKGIKAVKNSKAGKAASSVANKVGSVKTTVKSAITTGGDNITKAIAEKASKNDGALSKISGYLEKFFNFVKTKFADKFGTEVSEKALKFSPSSLIKSLKEAGDTAISKLITKVTGQAATKTSIAAVSFGISEVVFASIGALNGVSGTAKLFQIDSDQVDGTMKIIAGIFGALTGTTLGSIIDVILSFIGDIVGVDILHSMAVGMYSIIVGKDSDKIKALDDAQSEWKDAYLEERDKKLEEQYETQKKAGIIGEDVTYDQFVAGLDDGTYEASYTSFQDWNAQKNASFGDKAVSAVGKVVKGAKHSLSKIGQKLFTGEKTMTDSKGNTYTENQDGTYQVTSATGEDLGYISKKSLPDDIETKKTGGVVTKAFKKFGKGVSDKFNSVKNAASATIDAVTHPVSTLKKAAKNAGALTSWLLEKEVTDGFQASDGTYYDREGQHYSATHIKMDKISLTELSEMIKTEQLIPAKITTKERGITQIKNKIGEKLKSAADTCLGGISDWLEKQGEKASKVGESITNGFAKAGTAISNFFTKHTDKAWYTTDGSYYKSNGKTFDLFNSTGNKIAENISMEDFDAIKNTLTEGTVEVASGLTTGLKNSATHIASAFTTGWKNLGDWFEKKGEQSKQIGANLGNLTANILLRSANFLNDHKEKRWYSVEGGYYQSNGTTFDYYNDNGDLIAEGITKDEFGELCTKGVVTAEEGEVIDVKAGWKTGLDNLRKKAGESLTTLVTKGAELWDTIKSTNSAIIDQIKEKGVTGFIGSLFVKEKTGGWYDTQGNYYKENSDGTFNYYNMNGDVLKENIDAAIVDELRERSLVSYKEIVKDSAAQQAIKGMQDAASKAWEKAKESAKNNWEKFTSWLSGDNGGSGAFEASKEHQKGGSGKGIKKLHGFGGFGTNTEDTVNGASYFSQNDNRWANDAYNMGADDATMKDAGCGPTAMAMAVNTAKGGNGVTPTDMANIAKITGNRDNTGTNWNFVNQSANMVGVNSQQEVNPSAESISAQLDSGNPVVLSGYGDGLSTPYTQAGHYVVAVGKDKDGKVLVNDPRGKSYSKSYDLNTVAQNTGSSWMISDPAKGGNGLRNRINGGLGKLARKKHGGYGVNLSKWLSIVKSVKKAIADQKPGYSQTSWITIKVGGVSKKIRTDCSGFVGACLRYYDVWPDDTNIWTGNMTRSSSTMKATGFTPRDWTGWDDLKEGEILVCSSHTEIFCKNSGNNHYVYNCGSSSSTNNPEATISGHSSYDLVWSPGSPGKNVVESTEIEYTTSEESSDSSTSSSSSTLSGISGVTSYLGNFISEFANRAISGDFSNTDYSSLLTNNSGTSDTSVDNTDAVASGNATAKKGETVKLPDGLGTERSFMGWQCITSPSSTQYKLRQEAGQKFDENGYGKINGRYTVATTNTYGTVGDYIDVEQSDGTTLKAIIADIKSQGDAGCTKWGHKNGNCVIEFVVDKNKWYNKTNGSYDGAKIMNSTSPGNTSAAVTSITNQGTFFGGNSDDEKELTKLAKKKDDGGSGGGFGNEIHANSTNTSTGLSRRQRYKVEHAKKIAKGGYGTKIDKNNTLQSVSKSSKQIKQYITTTTDNSVKELFINAIEILASIANNTSDASTKLNALKSLQNLDTQSNSNVIINSNTSTSKSTSKKTSQASSKNSKKEATARAIAKGGY